MKPIFDPEELTMATEEEKKIFALYNKKISDYCAGKVEGIDLKNLAGGMSFHGKLVQSRSAMAMIKYDREKNDRNNKALDYRPAKERIDK